MKKFIYSALAAIGLLLSPSCSDENEVLSSSENEALVSFNVQLAGGIQTKAGDDTQTSLGNGKKANKLFVKVYEYTGAGASGTYIPGLDQEVTVNDLSATVKVTLVKGKSYNFLFWAQHEEEGWDNPYSIGNDGTITVTYGKSNDEKRDAFVGTRTGYVVSTSATENVELTRPFAQLNFLTTSEDIKSAAKAGIVEDASTSVTLRTSVTIPNVATTYNPFTGEIGGGENVTTTFSANTAMFNFSYSVQGGIESYSLLISNDPGSVESTVKLSDGSGTTYYVLATNYFLVNPANTSGTNGSTLLSSAELNITNSLHYPGLEVPNVPVKMNHRTNIYGALLSVTGNINVSVEAGFSGTHTEAGEQ